MKRTDEVWTSDNTDALDRLTLQDGFSQAYTPGVMMAWVTDVPSGIDHRVVPLKFRFLVAMSGSLGLGGNLNKYSPDDLQAAARYVAFYKRARPAVQRGALYRLIAPEGSESSATEYVSTDGRQAVLFAYLHSQQFGTAFPLVYLRGLDENALYKIEAIDPGQVQEMGTVSGGYLMHHGINLDLHSDYDSTSVIFEKQ
jgi:alpha-galactosidase